MSNVTSVELPSPSAKVAPCIAAGNELPLLDMADYLAGKPGALEQLAADIRAVHSNLGFMAVINHGVDQALIDAAAEQVRKAFALPTEELDKYRHDENLQGYWPANSVRNVRPGYEVEPEHYSTLAGWTVLRDREPNDSKVVNKIRHRAMNKWPDAKLLPDFKKAINAYDQAMYALGRNFLPVYSMALGQEPDYLAKDFVNEEWYNRLNHYSGCPNRAGELANTAHSDHSFITLLPMAPVAGLQVRTTKGEWLDAPYVPGAIVVNGGEWLNQLSNGKFIATPHRVTEPPSERISMPFFYNPGDEAMNDPAPGIMEPGEERKYPRKNFYEHFCGYIGAYTKA